MLPNPNMLDYTTVMSYHLTSLLNCFGKVYEKVVAVMLSEGCEVNHILYDGKIVSRKQRSAIDTVVWVIRTVQKAWIEWKLVGMLLIDIKSAFGNVIQNCLLCTMEFMEAYRDVIQWTESFMSDKRVGLLINGHQCEGAVVDTGVPQVLRVSPHTLCHLS